MSQVLSIKRPPAGEWLRLSDVDWSTYVRLLRVFAERPAVRLTYDRGELEIRSPALKNHFDGQFLACLVCTLTEELGLPLRHGGSTTLTRRKRRRGIEADDSFWIANAHRMAGRRSLNLRTDPPPDLAIEVDVTNSSLDRMGIYSALRVPEVWRLDDDVLTFNVLRSDGTYEAATHSLAFPLLTPGDLLVFIQQGRSAGDQNAVIRRFRAWMRLHLVKPPQSNGQ